MRPLTQHSLQSARGPGDPGHGGAAGTEAWRGPVSHPDPAKGPAEDPGGDPGNQPCTKTRQHHVQPHGKPLGHTGEIYYVPLKVIYI